MQISWVLKWPLDDCFVRGASVVKLVREAESEPEKLLLQAKAFLMKLERACEPFSMLWYCSSPVGKFFSFLRRSRTSATSCGDRAPTPFGSSFCTFGMI